jgi:predicted nucleic acid-binding protein
MALALENSTQILLLDDKLARRIAQAAGLTVWGTLKVLLLAKSQGLTESIEPLMDQLEESGMWMSEDIRERLLTLASQKQMGH